MIYNLTEKLRFSEDPKLVIGGTELTVCSDAEVVLTLLDVLNSRGEAQGAQEAVGLLFGEEDQRKLRALHLKLEDYLTVIKAAVQLALGSDPAAEDAPAGE